jgi:hypothetical protein
MSAIQTAHCGATVFSFRDTDFSPSEASSVNGGGECGKLHVRFDEQGPEKL